jgi:hypothetical protein
LLIRSAPNRLLVTSKQYFTVLLHKLGATSINANNIVTAAVTGDKLGATSINANNIVNGTITAAKITDSTITTGQFASSANSAITGKSVAMAIVFGG